MLIPKTDFSLSMKKLYQLFTEYRSNDISLVETQNLCLEKNVYSDILQLGSQSMDPDILQLGSQSMDPDILQLGSQSMDPDILLDPVSKWCGSNGPGS